MGMELWWNDTYGKIEVLVEKSVPLPLFPPQILYGLAWD